MKSDRAFARQFGLLPLSDEERTFPPGVLNACRDFSLVPGEFQPAADRIRCMGVDLASSLNQKSSWTVVFVLAVDPESKRRYPVEIFRKRMGVLETVRRIEALAEKWSPRLIYVESNA